MIIPRSMQAETKVVHVSRRLLRLSWAKTAARAAAPNRCMIATRAVDNSDRGGTMAYTDIFRFYRR